MRFLSAVIITFNEEHNILRCIQSLKMVADEILIMDSFSTDYTKKIALSEGVRVIEQKFSGYGSQKNAAVAVSKFDFILNLDADEFLSPELSDSIIKEKNKGFSADAYSMNRLNKYRGQWIRHGTWYPDRKVRLYNRTKGQWSDTLVHEEVMMSPGSTQQRLNGNLMHFAYETEEQHIDKNRKYSTLSALSMWERGKRTTKMSLVINPAWAFILSYFIKLGMLDGLNGFRIAKNVAGLTHMKNLKLLLLQKGERLTE
ncbi:MAG: glycosyltransferase family 2 protein [Chitinophagaceae bacterium]